MTWPQLCGGAESENCACAPKWCARQNKICTTVRPWWMPRWHVVYIYICTWQTMCGAINSTITTIYTVGRSSASQSQHLPSVLLCGPKGTFHGAVSQLCAQETGALRCGCREAAGKGMRDELPGIRGVCHTGVVCEPIAPSMRGVGEAKDVRGTVGMRRSPPQQLWMAKRELWLTARPDDPPCPRRHGEQPYSRGPHQWLRRSRPQSWSC